MEMLVQTGPRRSLSVVLQVWSLDRHGQQHLRSRPQADPQALPGTTESESLRGRRDLVCIAHLTGGLKHADV